MTDKNKELYNALIDKGVNESLCHEIAYKYMITDYAITRMLGYLYGHSELSEDLIIDEMLSILEDRQMMVRKHESERANAAINRIYNEGLE